MRTKDVHTPCTWTKVGTHQHQKVIYTIWGRAYHFSVLMCLHLVHVHGVHTSFVHTKSKVVYKRLWDKGDGERLSYYTRLKGDKEMNG